MVSFESKLCQPFIISIFLITFLEIELTDDNDIKQLCYESLKEIPGVKGTDLIIRSKIWNLIEESKLNDSTTAYVRLKIY